MLAYGFTFDEIDSRGRWGEQLDRGVLRSHPATLDLHGTPFLRNRQEIDTQPSMEVPRAGILELLAAPFGEIDFSRGGLGRCDYA